MELIPISEFNPALQAFYDGCQLKHRAYCTQMGYTDIPVIADQEWRLDWGKRYVRVVHGGSVFCFVDRKNGDVLKASSFKAPAKHARGNIFNEDNGLGGVTALGAAYLR